MAPLTQLPAQLRAIRFRIYPVLFGWYDSERGEASLKYFGELVERAARSAPNARISITSTNTDPLPLKCRVTADETIERIQKHKESQDMISSVPLS